MITASAVNAAILSTVDNHAVAFRVSFRVNRKDFYVRKLGFRKVVDVEWLVKKQGRYHYG